MVSKKRIYLSPPHISGREKEYINEVFQSNWFAPLGPQVDAFENELANYLGVKGVLALVSGTAAIHLALKLLEIGPGDKVLCSSLTFAASVNPVLYEDAEPVFIDSEPETWNMSSFALERALNDADKHGWQPKALIAVNIYGQSADYDQIRFLCEKFEVVLIEDAAESLGATYKGKPSGSLGKFGILSFNGNKIITTSGGGALVSNDTDNLARARYLAAQARLPYKHYEHDEVGYNYRLSNVLAAIGRAQLENLPEKVKIKREIYGRYFSALNGLKGITFMPEADYGHSNRWLTALTVDPEECGLNRDDIIDTLEKENIEARPVWKPMHLQPLYRGYKYYSFEDGNSISDRLFEQGLCLPSGSSLTVEEQERVIDCIKRLFKL